MSPIEGQVPPRSMKEVAELARSALKEVRERQGPVSVHKAIENKSDMLKGKGRKQSSKEWTSRT